MSRFAASTHEAASLPRRATVVLAWAITLLCSCAEERSSFPTELEPAMVQVKDGDSLLYRGTEIRLLGIDAPEMASKHFPGNQEPHATQAREYLVSLLRGVQSIRLRLLEESDKYDRVLAYVIADGRNVNAEMVQAGMACENITYYGFQGFPIEAGKVMAAAESRGPPTFEPPHEFRRRVRTTTSTSR